jgi:hypothetical protein
LFVGSPVGWTGRLVTARFSAVWDVVSDALLVKPLTREAAYCSGV